MYIFTRLNGRLLCLIRTREVLKKLFTQKFWFLDFTTVWKCLDGTRRGEKKKQNKSILSNIKVASANYVWWCTFSLSRGPVSRRVAGSGGGGIGGILEQNPPLSAFITHWSHFSRKPTDRQSKQLRNRPNACHVGWAAFQGAAMMPKICVGSVPQTDAAHFTCCKSVPRWDETIPGWWNYDAVPPLAAALVRGRVWTPAARSGRWGPGNSASSPPGSGWRSPCRSRLQATEVVKAQSGYER